MKGKYLIFIIYVINNMILLFFFSFHWYMAVICFPYLKGPVLMEDEITTVNLSGEDVIPNPCKPELPGNFKFN